MAVYMPPLVRKKKVPEHFHPDSFRVISQDAENAHTKFANSVFHGMGRRPWSRSSILPNIPGRETRVLPKNMPDFRANKPQPNTCNFLTHNVRSLNDPICTVTTSNSMVEQPNWWHTERETEYFDIPGYTRDTCYRDDYQYQKKNWPPPLTRHLSNPNIDGAHGIVPVNYLGGKKHKHRLYTEKMSYEHEYSSRKDPNYPIRSRRQGNFVWNEMKGQQLQNFIDYHRQLNEQQNKSEIKNTAKQSVTFNEVPDILPSTIKAQQDNAPEATEPQNKPGTDNSTVNQPNNSESPTNGVNESTVE